MFTYDPADPVPICGGQVYWGNEVVGPVDQRAIIARPDVCYYHSPRLDRDLRVIGEIWLELELVSSVEDTDVIAKFCVEEKDGKVTVLSNGSRRCRFRDGWREPQPLTQVE